MRGFATGVGSKADIGAGWGPLLQGALKRADASIETLVQQVAHLDAAIDLKLASSK